MLAVRARHTHRPWFPKRRLIICRDSDKKPIFEHPLRLCRVQIEDARDAYDVVSSKGLDAAQREAYYVSVGIDGDAVTKYLPILEGLERVLKKTPKIGMAK